MKTLRPRIFAEKLGVSRQKIYDLIRRGKLKAVKIGYFYEVPVSEMSRFKKIKVGLKDWVVFIPFKTKENKNDKKTLPKTGSSNLKAA